MRCQLVLSLSACVALLDVTRSTRLAAQQTGMVSGTVHAVEAGAPLAGASVVLVGTARTVLTNAQGQYRLSAPPGTHTVRARLIGYEAAEQRVMVAAGQTATADFKLAATPLSLNEVVVVGARTSRTAVETPVPVDVISTQEIADNGQTEVNQILATLAPSFNASHQTIGDGSDHINPASLRGLGPDQVLVLVNGKRRHSSALVHVNGTFGRGTVGVDLNAIPAAAIERIEVLRDGASAQYGSDAIAGVINIVLKRQTEHLDVSNTVGSTPGGGGFWDMADHHDGDQLGTDANYGFAVGDRGFFNVTASYLNRGATSRAARYSGNDIFPAVTTTAGGNAFHFFVDNSDNASMGAASPTTFDAGRLSFAQTVGNLDVVRPLGGWGGLRSLSFVAGAEFRREEYRIEAGEEASWQLGNGGPTPGADFDTMSNGAPKEPGSQVFPGFQPSNQVDRTRTSLSVYGGFESQVSERVLVDVGGRLEDYSDFGHTLNGKVASRFPVRPGRRPGRDAAAAALPALGRDDRAVLHERRGYAHHRAGHRRDARPHARRWFPLPDGFGEFHEDHGRARQRAAGDGRYVYGREPAGRPRYPPEPRRPQPARGRPAAPEGRARGPLGPRTVRRPRAGDLLRHHLLSPS